MDTLDDRPPASPAESPDHRPAVVARDDGERARLSELIRLAAGHLGEPAGCKLTADVSRVSARYGRVSLHWRRPPSAIEKAALDLAAVQLHLGPADHLVAARPPHGQDPERLPPSLPHAAVAGRGAVGEAAGAKTIDLAQSLSGEWMKLLLPCVRSVGPAAQTLAGLLKITHRETFVPVNRISRSARVPKRTAEKHLDALEADGWIGNRGRQRTRTGHPRRTCTWVVHEKTRAASGEYTFLPWWACCRNVKASMLSWSARCLLSLIMSRLASLKAAVDENDGKADLDADDLFGSIENMGGKERFRFSLDSIEALTGLSRKSIVSAKSELNGRKIVSWQGPLAKRGEWSDKPDILYPNPDFRVTVKPVSEDMVHVLF